MKKFKKCLIISIMLTLCLNIQAQTLQNKINQLGPTIDDYNDLLEAVNAHKITIKEIYNSGNNRLCIMANKFAINYDSDKDTLSDFYEIFKYETDPNNPDSDGDGIPDSEWNERLEYADTINYTTKIMNVYNLDAMNNAFQDYRVLETTDTYTIFELAHYPNNRCYKNVYQNPNWQQEYSQEMEEYLKPTTLCNWDEEMKNDLIKELARNGIHPNKLTDLELVRKVTKWIELHNKRLTGGGLDAFMEIENGQIIEPTREAHHNQFNHFFPNQSYEQIKNSIMLGKEMYYNRTIGDCLSSSTYYATVLRALGIPSRIVQMSDMVNGEDKNQTNLLNNLDADLKMQFKEAIPSYGWTNHYHLQCYIGNLWVDIDYQQTPYNFSKYLGDITFNHFKDYSEFVPMANDIWYDQVYGISIAKGFDSWYPYELIDLKNTKAKY